MKNSWTLKLGLLYSCVILCALPELMAQTPVFSPLNNTSYQVCNNDSVIIAVNLGLTVPDSCISLRWYRKESGGSPTAIQASAARISGETTLTLRMRVNGSFNTDTFFCVSTISVLDSPCNTFKSPDTTEFVSVDVSPVIRNISFTPDSLANCRTDTPQIITSTFNGGTAPFSRLWTSVNSNGNNTTTSLLQTPRNQPDITVRATPIETHTLTLTITDAFSCTASNSLTVTNRENPTANAGPNEDICEGDSVTIGTMGMAGLSYSWTPTVGLSNPNIARPVARAIDSTVNYSLTVTDGFGCRDTDATRVRSYLKPIIDNVEIEQPTGCDKTDGMITVNAFADGRNDLRYRLVRQQPSFGNTNTFSNLGPGFDTLEVTYVNILQSCLVQDTIRLTAPESPMATIEIAPDSLCLGETATFMANDIDPQTTYDWQFGAGNPSTANGLTAEEIGFQSLGNQVVRLVVERLNCRDTTTQTVVVLDTPQTILFPIPVYCEADSFVALANFVSGCATLNWESPAQANGLLSVSDSGTYIVNFDCENNVGCTTRDQLMTRVVRAPDFQYLPADTSGNPLVCLIAGESINNYLTIEGPNLTWQLLQNSLGLPIAQSGTGSPQDLVIPQEEARGFITIEMAIREESCESRDTLRVEFVPDAIFIPDLFTPNGDGVNDTWQFKIPGEALSNYSLSIMNRSGAVIFEQAELSEGFSWDGTINGQACPDGVYIYFINGNNQERSGYVTIRR